ncbi:hypothetical protein RA280_40225 [Cupriavidus sp. CV2]|uniref:hypothetical protein n=1 Tax=Cupriavidus ulmosensis TaxID=3065913 RepID=UPI00296B400C|nr:hypothetical protein [Cupriavidus sp. CV2]MDW3687851.1 hypothetical protein [Cupriavidus sp. CV2]
MTFAEELLSIIGQDVTTAVAGDIINRYGLNDVYDDPPFRRYIGSAEKGVDLLVENDRVFDIQFYVQKSTTHLAFSANLPFGIQVGMTDWQIHALLGAPETEDAVGSKYTVLGGVARLTVTYDRFKVVSYLSVKKIS